MSEYDHKQSEKVVGQLYPVLLDKRGKVIDGKHRLDSDSQWRTEKHLEIDTEEKFLIARCVANWHRRQVSREEKEEWINGLARIYKKQGLKVISKGGRNEIMARLMEVTGLSDRAIGAYLNEEYKRQYTIGKRPPIVPASQRIEKELGTKVVERHREEVLAEEKPKIEREVREKIIEEELKPKIKEELSHDAEFIMETIEKAPQVLPTLPKKVVDEEGRHIPTVTEEQMRKAKEAMEKARKEIEEKRKQPETKRRGELVKNWMAHGEVVGLVESLKCPVCGAGAENLVWRCHNITVSEAHKLLKKKLEA